MLLHGYDPKGADTHGAAYAREHPDDLPDEYVPDVPLQFGFSTVKTGHLTDVCGVPSRVVAGKSQQAMMIDTRRVGAERLEAEFPLGRLFRWKGLYWRVQSVNGVFVLLMLWGTKRRKSGWRLHTRGAILYADRVATKEAP